MSIFILAFHSLNKLYIIIFIDLPKNCYQPIQILILLSHWNFLIGDMLLVAHRPRCVAQDCVLYSRLLHKIIFFGPYTKPRIYLCL